MTDVVVIGAGIAGLAAAREAALAGASVTLVDPAPPGGKLRTTPFAGGLLDEGADAFLARVPDAVELCRELGLDGDLVSPAARRAWVWSHGRLRLLPEAQVLGVPTDLEELAESGIVSSEGLARARHDLDTPLRPDTDDVTIGSVMRERLGDEVAERLIDPLVGGINAGDTDVLSLAATVPQLDAAYRSGAPSLIAACQAQRAAIVDPSAPVFFAPRGGMGALPAALLDDLNRRGASLVDVAAAAIEPLGARWQVQLADHRRVAADAVVLAAPAPATAALLRPVATRAATLLAAVPYASVAMVSLAVPRADVDCELDGSGFLVPRVEGHTVTACSWASSKWAHLGDADTVLLRASVGRHGDERALALDDDGIAAAVVKDLGELMGLRAAPTDVRITRWERSLPQYLPGHLARLDAIDADLAEDAPGVVATGAAFRGLGVPACIRQGRAAARHALGTRDARP